MNFYLLLTLTMFKHFPQECLSLINQFIGPSDDLKNCFSKKVLPRLNKKWKLVGYHQPFESDDPFFVSPIFPCSYCYIHGNGIDISCLIWSTCINRMEMWVKKEDIFHCKWWKRRFTYSVLPYIENFVGLHYWKITMQENDTDLFERKEWKQIFSTDVLPYIGIYHDWWI